MSESEKKLLAMLETAIEYMPEGTLRGQMRLVCELHRQPEGVSADAMELVDKIFTDCCSPNSSYSFANHKVGFVFDAEKCENIIQAYGDACRLDGARKMQDASVHAVSQMWVVGGENRLMEVNDAIRALSPETVCKGE